MPFYRQFIEPEVELDNTAGNGIFSVCVNDKDMIIEGNLRFKFINNSDIMAKAKIIILIDLK